MSTAADIIRDRIVEACTGAAVAAAAGIASARWASQDFPHVFVGLGGYHRGRNRGRLPFLEVQVGRQQFDQLSYSGGTMQSEVTLRLHLGGRDQSADMERASRILVACLVAIRDVSESGYFAIGDDRLEPLRPGPWGHEQDLVLTVQHAYDRTTYEGA